MKSTLLATASLAGLLAASQFAVAAPAPNSGFGQLNLGYGWTDGSKNGNDVFDDPTTYGGRVQVYLPLSQPVQFQGDLFAQRSDNVVHGGESGWTDAGPNDATTFGAAVHVIHPMDNARIGIVGSVEQFLTEHPLGPDALCVNRSEFIERVSHHRRAIKAVLLDQGVLAGIGNLYADEVLFQVRLHPLTRADSISRRKLGDLYRQVGSVMRGSIAVASDFAALPEGYMLKDRVEGAECPRGNGLLAMTKVGGRTSIFCPVCQRLK